MNIVNKQASRKVASTISAFAICTLAGLPTASAASLNLSPTPIFLTGAPVQPNIFFLVDDSGSMNWELLRSKEAQQLWPGLRDSATNRTLSLDLTPDTGSEYLELCAGYNTLAYNPDRTYTPWPGFSDQPINNAKNNPNDSGSPTTNLTLSDSGGNPYGYMPWNDDGNGIYEDGECYANSVANTIDSSKFVPISSMTAAEQTNFANWFSYYRTREYVAKKALSEVISGSTARMGLATLHNNNSVRTGILDMTDATNKSTLLSNLLNVYSNGGTPLRTRLKDVGEYYKGNGGIIPGAPSPILSAALGGECQYNYTVLMSDGYWNGTSPSVGNTDGGTSNSAFDGPPYADAVSNTLADVAMKYYEEDLSPPPSGLANKVRGENPAQHMVTYTVAFGIHGNFDPNDPVTGDPKSPSFYGWPDPVTPDSPDTVDDMFHAAYNSRGLFLNAKDPDGLINSLNSTIIDIEARESSAAAVSTNATTLNTDTQVYQARFNSGNWSGELRALPISTGFQSTSPQSKCNLPIGSVCPTADWSTSGASSPFAAQTDTNRKIITYNPEATGTKNKGIPFTWPSSYPTLGDNDLGQIQINALLASAPSEVTISNNNYGGHLVSFLKGNRSNEGPGGVLGTKFRERGGKLGDIVNSAPVYVGAPRFLYPDSVNGVDLESVKYSTFKNNTAVKNRTAVVYVGSNDGMLHGFAASGAEKGKEVLAYVPSAIYKNLPKLADPNYNHVYFVDGSPAVGDAFFNSSYGGTTPPGVYDNQWHTVLLGGLSAGGQGIYALDVTYPDNFTATNATTPVTGNPAKTVLWEFTDTNYAAVSEGSAGATGDKDLGFTYSQPDIVKMNNGQWVAIFGNGYNNTAADGMVSTTGHAVLFIVDIATGKLVKKISTQTGSTGTPNGLGTVTPVDVNGDLRVDYIYAGDLLGNLWKFDVSAANVGNWDVIKSGSTPVPIFKAVDSGGNAQPITVRPSVSFHPDRSKSGLMIYFGTGKYLEKADDASTGQQTQTFYGIWDKNTGNYNNDKIQRSDLLAQSIIFEPGRLRVTSDNSINWSSHRGWRLDLVNTNTTENPSNNNRGERQVTNPLYRDGRIIFTTLLPSQSICDYGGSSYLMELKAESGGRLGEPPFDLNNDGVFDKQDAYVYTDSNGNEVVINPSGMLIDGIISAPTVLGCEGAECKLMNSTSGTVEAVHESAQDTVGRQSWRQLIR